MITLLTWAQYAAIALAVINLGIQAVKAWKYAEALTNYPSREKQIMEMAGKFHWTATKKLFFFAVFAVTCQVMIQLLQA